MMSARDQASGRSSEKLEEVVVKEGKVVSDPALGW